LGAGEKRLQNGEKGTKAEGTEAQSKITDLRFKIQAVDLK